MLVICSFWPLWHSEPGVSIQLHQLQMSPALVCGASHFPRWAASKASVSASFPEAPFPVLSSGCCCPLPPSHVRTRSLAQAGPGAQCAHLLITLRRGVPLVFSTGGSSARTWACHHLCPTETGRCWQLQDGLSQWGPLGGQVGARTPHVCTWSPRLVTEGTLPDALLKVRDCHSQALWSWE